MGQAYVDFICFSLLQYHILCVCSRHNISGENITVERFHDLPDWKMKADLFYFFQLEVWNSDQFVFISCLIFSFVCMTYGYYIHITIMYNKIVYVMCQIFLIILCLSPLCKFFRVLSTKSTEISTIIMLLFLCLVHVRSM